LILLGLPFIAFWLAVVRFSIMVFVARFSGLVLAAVLVWVAYFSADFRGRDVPGRPRMPLSARDYMASVISFGKQNA